MTKLNPKSSRWRSASSFCLRQWRTFLGAIAFYTCLPIPHHWSLEFSGIARLSPAIGLLIGGTLSGLDSLLTWLHAPILLQSALIITGWIAITGGLHLDGAIDAADGLAVLDPQRRLEVMADSRSGAFGVMAAVIILLLKTTALSSLESHRWFGLVAAASWGRWGQLAAIARYPYLKPTGTGAFHKVAIRSTWEAVPGLVLLLGISGCLGWLNPQTWQVVIGLGVAGMTIALCTGAWFNRKLGGHTGDTYGAVVEWTETLVLCVLAIIQGLGIRG